jgi:hypothetical protein
MSAPAFAREEVRPALTFALAVTVPLAALSGVIPITKTIQFGAMFSVQILGAVTPEEMVMDVLRAMGIALGITLASFAALAFPYVSLAAAYGRKLGRPAAWRTILYRSWLLPIGGTGIPFGLFLWGLPDWPALISWVKYTSVSLPMILLWAAMQKSARMAAGVRALPGLAVVLVPFVLFLIVQMLTMQAIAPLLPQDPSAATAPE